MPAPVTGNLEKVLQQQETLRTIIESISSELELRPLLTRIVQHACELLHAERGTIGLVDEERNLIRTEAVYRMPPIELDMEMPAGKGLAGRVLLTRAPVILNQYGELERPIHGELAQDAVVGLPIFWHGRMIGFFGIGADQPRRFDEHDVEMLTLLARHAAIAIENARLFAAERRRAARQTALNRIGKLVAGTLDIDELLQTAVNALCEHLHYSHTGVMLLDDDAPDVLCLVARSGLYVDHLPADYRQQVSQGIVGAAVRARASILTTDAPNDPRYLPIPGVSDLRSAVAVPIIVGDELLGALHVESRHTLDEEDVTLLEIAADQLGVAMSNARLFAAAKRRAARQVTLNRIGKLIAGTLDLDDLLQTAVQAIDEHLSYSNTAVLLVDPEQPDYLLLTARSGLYADNVEGPYRQHVSEGVVGLAARTRTRALVPDVRQDPNYVPIPDAPDIRAELALPLVVSDRLLGVLNVETTQPLSEADAADMEIVADQLSVGIANARLFESVQRSLHETQLLYETSRRIGTAMDVDDVIQAFLEHVAARGRYVCNIVLYEFDEAGHRSGVVVRGRWTPQEGVRLAHERYAYTRDALDPLLDDGQTVTIKDVHSDPRVSQTLREIQTRSRRPALAMIPMMVHNRRIGLVVLSYPEVYAWPEADLWPYQVTVAQIATTIHTRQQQLLLYESGREVAVLRERQRLARELHDSVTQLIFSMTLIAQSIAPAWQRSAEEGEQRVNRLLELSQSALAEMRALLFELRSAGQPAGGKLAGIARLRYEGLASALENYVRSVAGEGLAVRFEGFDAAPLPLDQEIALYRIAQEALNNVVKHAQAERVTVRLKVDAQHVFLTLEDDGVGFDAVRGGNGRSRFGLRTMRERAEALGGGVTVRSAAGAGTTVEVYLPRMDKGGRV